MRKILAWLLRFGGLFRKQRRDHEFADEMESHLQMHIEDNLRVGMSAAEEKREALMKLGGAGDCPRRRSRRSAAVPHVRPGFQFFARRQAIQSHSGVGVRWSGVASRGSRHLWSNGLQRYAPHARNRRSYSPRSCASRRAPPRARSGHVGDRDRRVYRHCWFVRADSHDAVAPVRNKPHRCGHIVRGFALARRCFPIPTRRAMCVDPIVALRYE
jgi:hypothetical protein